VTSFTSSCAIVCAGRGGPRRGGWSATAVLRNLVPSPLDLAPLMLPRLSQLRAPSLRRVVLIQPWAPSRDYSAASKSRRRSPTSPVSPSSPPPRIAAEPPTSGPSTQEPRITSHPKPWTRPEPPLVAAARAKSVKQRSVWESYLGVYRLTMHIMIADGRMHSAGSQDEAVLFPRTHGVRCDWIVCGGCPGTRDGGGDCSEGALEVRRGTGPLLSLGGGVRSSTFRPSHSDVQYQVPLCIEAIQCIARLIQRVENQVLQ
jgi:hypothetical protein